MLHKRLVVPIYDSWVFVVSDKEECVRLSACKAGCQVTEDDFTAQGMTIHGWGRNVLWLPPEAEVSTIVHECMHVVLNIFHVKGVHVHLDNQEPTAYLMGYITGEVIKAHNKLKAAV